jgi:hypothetical protein
MMEEEQGMTTQQTGRHHSARSIQNLKLFSKQPG